ncbi:hypothetical protein Nepgr_008140 [Nepenthes gracilis]|uniref:Auxilin-like protein 1 n=1 Tax=Nepenthes gracilis TaxID=150966 RepID=A0AAD3XJ40_NEPGR|nr:hypothetical protein Nepgr_008140 [Nepenthes gracilis]
MEGYNSHSHSHSHSNYRTKTSKKPCNGNGFAAYDDVFSGRQNLGFTSFAPRAEDYSEIFGSFWSSRPFSIPILHLPAVDDAVASFDAHTSKFDYSEVFGGFDAEDFAIPYDELFKESDVVDDFSEEAWTPAGTESLSEESNPSAFSENTHCFQTQAISQSFGSKQYDVFYHKVDLGATEVKPNVIHLATLDALPGYAYEVDEATSLQKTEDQRFCLQLADDMIVGKDFSGNRPEKNCMRKTLSHTSGGDTGIQSFGNDHKPGRAHSIGRSVLNPMFVSVSDIGLRTLPSHLPPPSRPSPVLADKKGDSGKLASDCRVPKSSSDIAINGSSPPFLDVEVGFSSSAAASDAAMKEAMENTLVKLKNAEELMVRKKDDFRSCKKPGLRNDANGEEKVRMIILGDFRLKDDRQQATHGGERSGRKSSGKRREGARNALSVLPGRFDQSSNVAKKPSQRKQKKKYTFLADRVLTEGTGEWKEAMQYYEFITTDDSRTATLPNNVESLVLEKNAYQPCNNNGNAAALELQEDDIERTEAARKIPKQGESAKSSNLVIGVCETYKSRRRLKATNSASRQEYYEKMVKVAQEVHERVNSDHADTDRASEINENERKLMMENEVEKNERRLDQVPQLVVSDEKWKHSLGPEENDRKLREAHEKEEKKRKEKDAFEREDNERRSNEAREREQNARRVKEAHTSGVNESQREAGKREENERRGKEAGLRQENDQGVKEAYECEEDERKGRISPKVGKEISEKTFELEENEKGLKEATEGGGKKIEEVCARERYAIKEALTRAQNEKNHEETIGFDDSGSILNEDAELEECKKHEVPEEEKDTRLHDALKPVTNNKNLEEVHTRFKDEENFEKNFEQGEVNKGLMKPCELEEAEKAREYIGEEEQRWAYKGNMRIPLVDMDEKPDNCPGMGLHLAAEFLKSFNGACCLDEKNVKPKLTEVACKLENPHKKAQAFKEQLANEGNGEIMAVSLDGKEELNAVKRDYVLIDERTTEPTAGHGDAKNEQDEDRVRVAPESVQIDEKNIKSDEVCIASGEILVEENKKISDASFVAEFNYEQGGRTKNTGKAQVLFDQEKNKVISMPNLGENGFTEHVRQTGATQPMMLERKESFQERFQLPKIIQIIERTGKIMSENFTSEEEKADRLKKEKELENERLRKLEEDREREREREKDRMAVDIATHEIHERACSGARERAERAAVERATAEVRQRGMAEARKRLESACAEAREKSTADKVSAEARLRAERAAVERATLEARERAIEKAMAERATSVAREQVERSVSDKFSSSSRDMGMRQSSSFCNTDKFEAAGGESAKRCKARLERHCRTAERMSMALAEKNRRDLLAQREQEERNRLAETLDADIKRWSTSKEGNLRALLSTLQYILGPDSGWQPIPLTEVITAAAVKKAYRKATLCVHPDKLQQRGASIQQKYICEKVFDLLKGAWNKFNSEEW